MVKLLENDFKTEIIKYVKRIKRNKRDDNNVKYERNFYLNVIVELKTAIL